MAILSTAKIVGMLASAKKTGRRVMNTAGQWVDEIIEDFASGFAGHGWKIWERIAGVWRIEADELVIRRTMVVFELLISKIRSIKGALNISQGGGKIKTVELKDNNWYITIEDEMSFMPHDFIRCQHFSNNSKFYWVEIADIINDNTTLVIPNSEFLGSLGYTNGLEYVKNIGLMSAPEPGDEIVQFGNSVDKDRQSAIYIHADESGQPAIDILFGINSKSFVNCLKMRVGGDIPGTDGLKGFYCENGMIKSVDESGHVVYQINPDGSAMFGDGSAKFNRDRSGHIAGGAIAWKWDNTKQKFICTMQDVQLTWDNLSEEVRENLKGGNGTDGVGIESIQEEYRLSLNPTYLTLGKWNQTRPEWKEGYYLWTRSIINYTNNTSSVTSPICVTGWKGDTGTPGADGNNGEDSVVYQLAPSTPFVVLDTDGYPKEKSMTVSFYKTIGNSDPMLCTGFLSYMIYSSSRPVGSFTTGETLIVDTVNRGIDKITVSASFDSIKNPVCRLTIPAVKEGFTADWLKDWNNNKTEIDGEFVVSPKMFSGTKNADGKLTGVAFGRDCATINGVKRTGIFAVVDDEVVFELDPITKKYKFKGRVEADEGYFKGNVTANSGNIGWFKIVDGNLIGYDADGIKRIALIQSNIPALSDLYDGGVYRLEKSRFGIIDASGTPADTDDDYNSDFSYNYNIINSSNYYNMQFEMTDQCNPEIGSPGNATFVIPFTIPVDGSIQFNFAHFINKESNETTSCSTYSTVSDVYINIPGEGSKRISSGSEVLLVAGDYSLTVALKYRMETLSTGTYPIYFGLKIKEVLFRRVLTCNFIGKNGTISRFGAYKYIRFQDDSGFEVRYGNHGLRISDSGIQKLQSGNWISI